MTATAQGSQIRCDKTGCTQPGTVESDAYFFCAAHAGGEATPARPQPLRTAPGTAGTITTLTVPAGPGPIGLLLEQASGHSSFRVRRAGGRIEKQLDDLRALVRDLAADEQRQQAEKAAKDKARADVERLEQQLAAAKTALRGTRKTAVTEHPGNTKPRTQAQLDALAKGRATRAANRAAAQAAQA